MIAVHRSYLTDSSLPIQFSCTSSSSSSLSLRSPYPHPVGRPNTTARYLLYAPLPPSLRLQSSLHPSHWLSHLRHYSESEFPALLAGTTSYSAHIGYTGPFLQGRNHRSILRIPSQITSNIQSELALDPIWPIDSLPHFYVNFLGLTLDSHNMVVISRGYQACFRDFQQRHLPTNTSNCLILCSTLYVPLLSITSIYMLPSGLPSWHFFVSMNFVESLSPLPSIISERADSSFQHSSLAYTGFSSPSFEAHSK